jgi:arylsulfatase A-like enzyme
MSILRSSNSHATKYTTTGHCRPLRWRAATLAVAMASLLSWALVAAGGAKASAAGQGDEARHVLLISVDGLHASDLSQCEANGECPNLKMLADHGTTYSDALTSMPSDSAPGLMALASGGDPRLTGVYYDDSYDRTMYAPAAQTPTFTQDCQGPAGTETQYAENVDANSPNHFQPNGFRPVIGAVLDPTQFPYAWQNGRCAPVYPNDFLRTNTVFSVAHAAGLWTAWADKHPVYNQEVAGHGTPHAVSDPFNTEINADIVPAQLTDTRGRVITFPLPNPDGTGPFFITDSVGNTESYDQIKVDAILNEIDGLNSWGTRPAPVPAIFGMNFQSVSVAQKLVDPILSCVRSQNGPNCDPHYQPGGYEPGTLAFTPQLSGAIEFVDSAIGSIVSELQKADQLRSTTIIVTAKHGQSPIDPTQSHLIGHAEVTDLTNAGVQPVQVTDDDIALVWLQHSTQGQEVAQTQAAAAALAADQSGANNARIQYVLSGPSLAQQFDNPLADPRTPDVIVQPIPGTIYSSSSAKVAEHGGFAADDTHVALVVTRGSALASGHGLSRVVTKPVRTFQVAPTILQLLGLDPTQLDSVRQEHVQVLPGLGAH